MSKKDELKSELQNIISTMEDHSKRSKDVDSYTAEDKANFDAANTRYEEIQKEFDAIQAKEKEAQSIQSRAQEAADYINAVPEYRDMLPDFNADKAREMEVEGEQRTALELAAWMQSKSDTDYSPEVRQAHDKGLINLNRLQKRTHFKLDLSGTAEYRQLIRKLEQRTLTGGTNLGAEMVPQGFVNRLEKSMLDFGSVRAHADVIRTTTGNPLKWPTIDDTSNTGEIVAAGAAGTATNNPATDNTTFNSYKYASGIVKVALELLTDSAFSLSDTLADLLGERVARKQNTDFTVGDGSSKAAGIVTGSSLGETAASATAITLDEILDLIDSVDGAYARMGKLMMKRSTKTLLRKLKDGDSRYLWEPRVQPGQPEIMFGHEVVTNEDMPAATTGLKSVLFGDFSKYKIRDVNSVSIRMSEHRFWDEGETAWVAELRSDGKILDAGTDPIKHLIQA